MIPQINYYIQYGHDTRLSYTVCAWLYRLSYAVNVWLKIIVYSKCMTQDYRIQYVHDSRFSYTVSACNWGMKLNASKTKTMIVSKSRAMYPQSPTVTPWYIGCDMIPDLRSIFAQFPDQLLKDLVSWSPGEYSIRDRFVGDAFVILSCPFWCTVLQSGARLLINALSYWTV